MIFEVNQRDLRKELARVYAVKLSKRLRVSISSPAFLAINPLERGIKFLATRIGSRLIDLKCGGQPYRSCFSGAGVEITSRYFNGDARGIDSACSPNKIPLL